ncbi:MAG TPA: hypothetical protein VK061_04610 [Bacillota bacterium]|nr:hypothetical protein [Bacillota bacterium]
MIQTVFTIGIIMTVITVILAIVLARMKLNGYTLYYPFAALFITGLILLLFATILGDRVHVFGTDAGLGGLGIACLFSSAIGWVIASVLDAYAHN